MMLTRGLWVAIREAALRRGSRFWHCSPLPHVSVGAGKWWKLGEVDVLWSG